MTEAQITKLARHWQNKLGLSEWEIEIDTVKPATEDCHASAWRSNDYDCATIYFDPEWRKWSEVEAQQHLVHELLHLCTRDVDRVIGLLDGQLHRDLYSTIENAYDHAIEGVIDRLARRIVR